MHRTLLRRCSTPALAIGCVVVAAVGGCERSAAPSGGGMPANAPAPWFTDITDSVGLSFRQRSGATGEHSLPEIMGGGAALLDGDGDGDLDVYLTNGRGVGPGAEHVVNRYFRQDDGRFVDATEESGLGDDGYGMGVAVGDVDNDGDPDVYVSNWGPDRLYRNRGDGTFEDVTTTAGIDVPGWSTSAAFVDFDRDGDLDLFVAQYLELDLERECRDNAGRPDYCSPGVFPPVSDVLLRNEGDGTFVDVSAAAGMRRVAAHGLGVVCADLDDDAWPDIYVANDGDANHLWTNQGDGTFRETAVLAGAAYNLHAKAEAGMGVVAADLDGDERLDLFVTHLANESNTLYRNEGAGRGFKDVTGSAGLAASSMPHTGFGTVALDLELDGDLDLLVVNGAVLNHEVHPRAAGGPEWQRYAEPNLAYLNDGAGRFSRRTLPAWEQAVEISRALACGDVDGDGDLDLLVSNVEGPARLLRNDAPRSGRWIAVRCTDPDLRRDAIGSRVTALGGGLRQVRVIAGGFGYLSSSPPVAFFGLGTLDRVDAIEVRWPDGTTERFGPFDPDQLVHLEKGAGSRAGRG